MRGPVRACVFYHAGATRSGTILVVSARVGPTCLWSRQRRRLRATTRATPQVRGRRRTERRPRLRDPLPPIHALLRVRLPRARSDAAPGTAGGQQDKLEKQPGEEEEVDKISPEEASGPLGLADYVTIQHVDGGFLTAEGVLDDSITVHNKPGLLDDCVWQICPEQQYSAKKELLEFIEELHEARDPARATLLARDRVTRCARAGWVL